MKSDVVWRVDGTKLLRCDVVAEERELVAALQTTNMQVALKQSSQISNNVVLIT